MDIEKCAALKRELEAGPETRKIVAIARFFDGNDDLGSIGCNLMNHPGIDAFHAILAGLLKRQDVKAVYAQIAEVDPGEDSWPFTDTVLVVGSISSEELQQILAPLEPDEVGPANPKLISSSLSNEDKASTLVAWWD